MRAILWPNTMAGMYKFCLTIRRHFLTKSVKFRYKFMKFLSIQHLPFSSIKSLLLEYLIRLKSKEWKNNFMIFWTKFRDSGHSFRLARGLSYSIVSHTWSPQWMPGIILNWRYPVLYTYIFVYISACLRVFHV